MEPYTNNTALSINAMILALLQPVAPTGEHFLLISSVGISHEWKNGSNLSLHCLKICEGSQKLITSSRCTPTLNMSFQIFWFWRYSIDISEDLNVCFFPFIVISNSSKSLQLFYWCRQNILDLAPSLYSYWKRSKVSR